MIPFLENRNLIPVYIGGTTRAPYPLHVHEIVEIICVKQGRMRVQIGSEKYDLEAGDVAAVFPYVPHSFDTLSEDSKGLSAFFPPSTISEFSAVFSSALPSCPVLKREKVPEEIYLAVKELSKLPDGERGPYQMAYLHLLLSYLLNALELDELGHYRDQAMSNRILCYITDHAFENISLESTAEALGISRYYLSHVLNNQLKTSLRRFINGIRVSRAKELMREPQYTLTQVCFECGYDSMRTFRRAFQSETGLLPSEYQHGEGQK